MASITNLNPTTELDAVNSMLSAIGEAPVATLLGVSQADVEMAVNILRSTTREVQLRRWRFNTEYGYTVTSAGSSVQNGATVNVFFVPAQLGTFRLSNVSGQENLDAIIRPSRFFQPGTLVFYDRLGSRDGFALSTLQIDPVWVFDFEQMPETARRYTVVAAGRRFAQQVAGSEELGSFSEQDEENALRILIEDQQERPPLASGTSTEQSETDALNLILTAANQQAVASVNAILDPEGITALNIFRATTREVLAEGWSFNTEFGLELQAASIESWTSREGVTETIYIFQPPAGLLGFHPSNSVDQQGSRDTDTEIRMVSGQQVFYDRARNRHGWADRTVFYIDALWMQPFEQLPEQARRYIVVLAGRRYATRFVGNQRATLFSQEDERKARRDLVHAFGIEDTYNLFSHNGTREHLGGRTLPMAGVWDPRSSVGR